MFILRVEEGPQKMGANTMRILSGTALVTVAPLCIVLRTSQGQFSQHYALTRARFHHHAVPSDEDTKCRAIPVHRSKVVLESEGGTISSL